MAFTPKTISKELDFANLAKHNDNNAAIKTELDAHGARLATMTDGAEPNQNAFASVNDVVATGKSDALEIVGSTGITVTTSPTNKRVTITATGTAAPGAHASTHGEGGSDPIPELIALQADVGELETNIASVTSQLADISKMGVNVCAPPYNADPTGVVDSTAAFNAALNAYMRVYVPEGIYKIAGTINIVKNGQKLIGAGIRATQLISSNANLPIITVNNGLNWLEVSNMTLDRSVPATGGGHGLNCPGLVSNTYFRDLFIQNQFIGLVLGGTDWGEARNVTVQFCYNDGIYMQNLSTFGSCQWQMIDILVSQNNGTGISVHSVAGMDVMNLGKWVSINSFANGGFGISVVAVPSCHIAAFRIAGGFLGADGNSEIYLDTYGGNHAITDVFMEQAGTQVTGRTQTTPKSNVGSGIELTVNNTDVQISNCYSSAMAKNGISSRCSDLIINGGSYIYGGQATVATEMNGIAIYAGSAMLCGVRMNSNKYGLYAWDGQIITFTGCTFKNNTTAPVLVVSNPTYMVASGNSPSSIGTVIPAGGLLVGAGAASGVPTDGEINVSSNIKKNNVVYTNP